MDNPQPSIDSILEDTLRVSTYLPRFFPSQWGQAGQYEFHLVQSSEAHDLKAELGLPDNTPAGIVTLEKPFKLKRYENYTYKVFITYRLLDDVPVPQWADFEAVPLVSIVIWWRRVYCHGIVAYLEARGDFRTGKTPISLHGLENVEMQEAQCALEGLALFRKIERRGRSRRRMDPRARQEFCETIVGLIRRAIHKGMEPSEQFIAELYRVQRSNNPLHIPSVAEINRSAQSAARTLRNHLKGYGYTWQDMLNLARTAP